MIKKIWLKSNAGLTHHYTNYDFIVKYVMKIRK